MVEQRLRRENEGESPSKIIRDYVSQGYGIKAMSQAMEIHPVTCKKLEGCTVKECEHRQRHLPIMCCTGKNNDTEGLCIKSGSCYRDGEDLLVKCVRKSA